jgi:hypothetical protein
MLIIESQFANFAVWQLLERHDGALAHLVEVKTAKSVNEIHELFAFKLPIDNPPGGVLVLVPPKAGNENSYFGVHQVVRERKPASFKLTVSTQGLLSSPRAALNPAQDLDAVVSKLLASSDQTEAYGVPRGHGLPAFVGVQLVVREHRVKVLVAIGGESASIDPLSVRYKLGITDNEASRQIKKTEGHNIGARLFESNLKVLPAEVSAT